MNSNSAVKLLRGRPKGSKNKVSGDLKELILNALQHVGSRTYLEKIALEQPASFVKLLAMLVPREIQHSGVITGVQVNISTNLALASGSTAKQIQTSVEGEYPPQQLAGSETGDEH